MKINRILLLFFVLVVLSSFASATDILRFNATWNSANCAGDCWGSPNKGGSWKYTNTGNMDWAISSGLGFCDDTASTPEPLATSKFNYTLNGKKIIWTFRWKYVDSNAWAIINDTISSKYIKLYSGGHIITTGNGINGTNLGVGANGVWSNYTVKMYLQANYVEIYVDSVLKQNTSISSEFNNLNSIRLGSAGGGIVADAYFDNMTIVETTSSYVYSFYREQTNKYFNFSSSLLDSATLKFVCANGTSQYDLKTTAIGIGFDVLPCAYTSIMAVLDYNGTVYSRTLMPSNTSQDVEFFLLDLQYDSAVEKDVTLNDLTGDFANGTIIIKKLMTTGIETITENQFDISQQVVLYLLRDNIYTVHIRNSAGEERVLGNLFATVGGIELTFPEILFAPDHRLDFNSIRWEYTYNTTLLRVHYEDLNFNTTRVQFYVLNATNHSQSFFDSTINGNTSNDATISYNIVSPNGTYYACLNITHNNIGNHKSCDTYSQNKQIDVLDGLPNATAIKFWSALIIIICIGLSFGYAHAGIGAIITTFFTMVAIGIGWFPLNAYTTSMVAIMGLFSVLAFIIDERKKP